MNLLRIALVQVVLLASGVYASPQDLENASHAHKHAAPSTEQVRVHASESHLGGPNNNLLNETLDRNRISIFTLGKMLCAHPLVYPALLSLGTQALKSTVGHPDLLGLRALGILAIYGPSTITSACMVGSIITTAWTPKLAGELLMHAVSMTLLINWGHTFDQDILLHFLLTQASLMMTIGELWSKSTPSPPTRPTTA